MSNKKEFVAFLLLVLFCFSLCMLGELRSLLHTLNKIRCFVQFGRTDVVWMHRFRLRSFLQFYKFFSFSNEYAQLPDPVWLIKGVG